MYCPLKNKMVLSDQRYHERNGHVLMTGKLLLLSQECQVWGEKLGGASMELCILATHGQDTLQLLSSPWYHRMINTGMTWHLNFIILSEFSFSQNRQVLF